MIIVCNPRYNRRVKESSLSTGPDNLLTRDASRWLRQALERLDCQWQGLEPLRAEASHRRFYRVPISQGSFTSLVLMTSPPDLEQNDAFVALSRLFLQHDLYVPEVLAEDRERGYFLMTDLGRLHLGDVYESPQRERGIALAIDTLHQIAVIRSPLIGAYSEDRFRAELEIFSVWFMQGLLSASLPPACDAALDNLVEATQMQPQSCIHRDYHSRNLLVNDGCLGIVDFQDALIGPRLYDLASLLRDCYYVFPETDVERWLNYFLARAPEFAAHERSEIKRLFDFTALQRQLKAIGIFARLYLRDAKRSHLKFIQPNLQRVVDLSADYPALATLHMQLKSCIKRTETTLAGL